MTLYSKNGSIPKPETDGTEGWIEVEEAPTAPEGKEVVWWYPPGWVVRDLKPEQSVQTFTTHDLEGNLVSSEDKLADWSWSQSEEKWVAYALPELPVSNDITLEPILAAALEPIVTTDDGTVIIDTGAAATEAVTLSSADVTISLDVNAAQSLDLGTASETITIE